MRFALAALLLAACDPYPTPGPPIGDDAPIFYPDGGTPTSGECTSDAQCGTGNVCTDIRQCWPSDQVHRVSVHWTISGQTPDDTNCTPSPYLDLTVGSGPTFYPVRCAADTFTFLKLPDFETTVTLAGDTTGTSASADIPAAGGDVTVDLTL